MPLLFALAVSAVLHAAAITAPGWDLPGMPEPEAATIDAHLVPPHPTAVAAVAPLKRPPRAAPIRKVPLVPVAAAAAATEGSPAAGEALPAAEPAIEPPPPPAAIAEASPAPPPAPPWPRTGRVRYVVTYGESGFIIGETVHEWRVDSDRYTISSVATPRGLAALRGKIRSQSSEGEITAEGLRPHAFRDQREGREPEAAVFDWRQATVAFSGGRGESRVASGTQDMVSVFYQLAWQAPRENIDISVATASRVGRWKFEWVGEENVDVAGSSLSTLHLRTRADGDVTEVWLAPSRGGLPVKIRHVDRKGDTFEQTADLMEIQG